MTPTQWLDCLAAGSSFVTNGPLLELSVDERSLGSQIELTEPRDVTVRARGVGRVDFQQLELVQNGDVVLTAASRAEAGHFIAEMELSLAIDRPCWLALRTPPRPARTESQPPSFPVNEYGGKIFAHTSPIYVRLGGKDVFDRSVAFGLLDEMKSELQKIETQAVFASDTQRRSVYRVYQEAMARLTDRLKDKDSGAP